MSERIEQLRRERQEWWKKAKDIAQRANDENRDLDYGEQLMYQSFARKFDKLDAEIRTRSDPKMKLMEIEAKRWPRETRTPEEDRLEELRLRGILLDREIEEHQRRITG